MTGESKSDAASLQYAKALDENDDLRSYRDKFFIPQHNGKDMVYLCGNSLGLQPKSLPGLLQNELLVWQECAVEGHFDHKFSRPWMTADENCTPIIKKLVGAQSEDEVAVMDTLTANLHFLFAGFYKPTAKRYKILMESLAFSSDHYMVQSQVRHHGFAPEDAILTVSPRPGSLKIHLEDILKVIDKHGEEIAIVFFGGVNFISGQLFDMKKITEVGHAKGCVVGFDLAHAIGNVELKLHDWGVDFAAFCTYKYLNAGPGGIAGIFVNNQTAEREHLCGWWGNVKENRFKMDPKMIPLTGAKGYQLSNPNIMAMTCLYASLQVYDSVDLKKLFEKRDKLHNYMRSLFTALVKRNDIKLVTPVEDGEHGAQLSIELPSNILDGVFNDLRAEGILCDERRPNIIRSSAVPLYNTFEDVWKFVTTLASILNDPKYSLAALKLE